GAPRSRGRAPTGWDPGVHRWQWLAPYEPPQTAGRQWKCQELPFNILLKCSVCKQNVTLGHGGNTRYAPPCYCPLTLRCPRGDGKSAFEILIHRSIGVKPGVKSHPVSARNAASISGSVTGQRRQSTQAHAMIGLSGRYLVIRSGAGLVSFLQFMFIDP